MFALGLPWLDHICTLQSKLRQSAEWVYVTVNQKKNNNNTDLNAKRFEAERSFDE